MKQKNKYKEVTWREQMTAEIRRMNVFIRKLKQLPQPVDGLTKQKYSVN